MNRTFIIAEAGVNHNADLGLARGLIDAAAAAGADAVKFQTAIPELVVTRYAQKADYQKETSRADESQLEMIRKILFPLETHRELKAYCEERGVIFFSTAFDPVSLEFLEKLGQPYHKIPSGEITNLPYLRQVGAYRRPTILSTGMSTLGEIEAALEVLEQSGTNRERITVLHCNTEYPTPMTDVNLRAMQTIRDAFGVRVGYSDHTAGIEVSLAAVALGATMIEKHFTLDRQLPGPDHKASLEPDELKAMVSAIRNIELAMGDGIKRPSSSESRNKDIARRSLVAAHAIRVGEAFSAANLTAKRPGSGLSPMRWDEVMGRKAPRDFLPDEMIEL
ncbi:MAG: N-acetylneuraminate synthase [Rhodocyclaceae bacterium]|nr:MAG: N-acetylneuraminate synthase [Rhodocyclaceae bacterium]TND05590.1 MAG: N-acetylneuraminate synthase [Rhodocyclaceae bacterium]